MYIDIKIGKHEFSFGNDRKGEERRREDKRVEDSQREISDRRKQEPDAGQDVEEQEDKG